MSIESTTALRLFPDEGDEIDEPAFKDVIRAAVALNGKGKI